MSFASKGRATITISLPQQTKISLNEFTAIAVQREMPLVVFYYQIYALWTEPTWNEGGFTLRGKAHGMIKRRTVEEENGKTEKTIVGVATLFRAQFTHHMRGG